MPVCETDRQRERERERELYRSSQSVSRSVQSTVKYPSHGLFALQFITGHQNAV